MENIAAEECRENKVYRINTILDGAGRQLGGHISSRSGDGKKFLDQNPMKVIKVKGLAQGRAR